MVSEQLQERANEVLLKMLEGLDRAGEFAVEQVPLVVQELLTWHLVVSLLWFTISAVVMITSIVFIVSVWRGRFEDRQDAALICLFLSTIPLAAFFIMVHNIDWLQILVAPRLYLLEYAAGLVK